MKRAIPPSIFAALVLTLTAHSSQSQTLRYWDATGSGAFGTVDGTVTWTSPLDRIWANSNTGGSARLSNYTTTSTDIINFGGPVASLGVLTSNPTIPVSGTQNAGSLSFNTLGGNLTLSGGTIALSAAGSITTVNSAQTHTISSALAGGSTSITKLGAGSLVLSSASNTFSGSMRVNAGKLTIPSTGNINSASGISIGAGEFNYNSSTALTKPVSFSGTGGTLSGVGTINPDTNITSGNTLAIGNAVGAMNFGGNLTVSGIYLYELTSGNTTADLGHVVGSLTLGGVLDLVQLGTYTNDEKFTLFGYDSLYSGLFKDSGGINTILDDAIFTDAGGLWRLNYNDSTPGLNGGISATNTFVTITAVPEPSSAAFLGALGVLLLVRRRC